MVESAAVSTVIGGLISGLVGVGIVEYRYWKERNAELESWHTKTIRLSERIEYAEDDIFPGALKMIEKLPYIRNTCAGVNTMMAENLTEAPSNVDPEVIRRGENLVEACQLVKDTDVEQKDFLTSFRNAQVPTIPRSPH